MGSPGYTRKQNVHTYIIINPHAHTYDPLEITHRETHTTILLDTLPPHHSLHFRHTSCENNVSHLPLVVVLVGSVSGCEQVWGFD